MQSGMRLSERPDMMAAGAVVGEATRKYTSILHGRSHIISLRPEAGAVET